MAQVVAVLRQLFSEMLAANEFLPLLVPIFLVFVLFRFVAGGRPTSSRMNKLPPSPPALPLIGHAHLIGALPHISLWDLATRYGGEDFMMLRLGVVPTLVASSLRAAQAVLRTHDQSFASRPRSVCGDVLLYGPSDVALVPYGEHWRLAKKLVTTHLLNTKKVQSYRIAREEEVGLVINNIRDTATKHGVVDMSELLNKFTNDIVCRAVAGRSFRVEGRDRVFRHLMDKSMVLVGGFNLDNFYPTLAKVAGGIVVAPVRRNAERLREQWDKLLDKLIDEHTAGALACHEDGGGDDQQESDFIHVLLSKQQEYELTRDSIKAILANMFVAGTDTTYLVLELAMVELMRHKDVMAKLQHEVRSSVAKGQKIITEDNIAGMTYLKAVIKETLRLHPPTPLLLPHLSVEDCDIDSYTIPAGTTVLVNAWAIGRDHKVWDAADKFMPERFIDIKEFGGVDITGKDLQSLSFGLGRRMCPGTNFALISIEILLGNLMYHFDWDLPKGVDQIDMTRVFKLTLSRKEKLLLSPIEG